MNIYPNPAVGGAAGAPRAQARLADQDHVRAAADAARRAEGPGRESPQTEAVDASKSSDDRGGDGRQFFEPPPDHPRPEEATPDENSSEGDSASSRGEGTRLDLQA